MAFVRRLTSNNAPPLQPCVFEIDQQGNFQPCNGEAPDHLRHVRIIEGLDYFGVGDHPVAHNQVRNQPPNQMTFVVDGESALFFKSQSLFRNSIAKAFS